MNQKTSLINIVVADDHPVVVLGIKKILEEDSGLKVVGSATSVSELFSTLDKITCNILICDYSFDAPDQPDGILLLERIRRLYPDLSIIVLTAHDDLVIVQKALQLGVIGFLSKASCELHNLVSVVYRVLDGERYLDPNTSQMLLKHVMSSKLSASTVSSMQLTVRELEVVRLFSRGMSVTEIARHTNRSIKTISTQKKKAMIKLGVINDVGLINASKEIF
ncbi:response regulator [Pseudomonas sp. KCJK9016]|uniref:response regulator n=1 Tax=Pseudomonas sp. KCJK9016 TaxID=3344556 RepID=UPI003906097C